MTGSLASWELISKQQMSLVLDACAGSKAPQDCKHETCRQDIVTVRKYCEVRQIGERLTNVSNLTSSEVSGTKQGAGGKSVNPILIPKQV